jgi:hypothetical protein
MGTVWFLAFFLKKKGPLFVKCFTAKERNFIMIDFYLS